MISVEAHRARCLAAADPLPPGELPLLAALGSVLAERVVSPIDLPSFDNSSMDGYAVRLADLAHLADPAHHVDPAHHAAHSAHHAGAAGAGDGAPSTVLPVVADLPAQAGEPSALPPRSAVRIMTGAPLPPGTEAVVPVEWTDGGRDRVRIDRAPAAGQFLRRAADDVRAGEAVLEPGAVLTERRIALLAALGRVHVRVHPRPRVAVIPTGSELVAPGDPLRPGEVYDSNGFGLVAAARAAGAEAEHLGMASDDPHRLGAALLDAARQADLVLTSGGVSAGAYDAVKQVLRELDPALGEARFDKVAMQPGMPQGFGVLAAPGRDSGGPPRRVPIITLPGNPVSAMVSFEVFARPMLLRLAGHPADRLERPTMIARAAVDWSSPAGKRQFVRAVLEAAPAAPGGSPAAGEPGAGEPGAGEPAVRPVGGQGSHLVADLAAATCLAVVPEDITQVRVGDRLRCMILEQAHPDGS